MPPSLPQNTASTPGLPWHQNSSRVFALFLSALVALLGTVAAFWIAQPVSSQELIANYAKAQDFFSGMSSMGGLPWWTPNFLQGTSLATAWPFMVGNIVLGIFSLPFGFLAGPKIATLFVLAVGAAGMFRFIKGYSGDDWAAFIGGFLFLLCPSLLTRATGYEHFVVVCAMALLPWAFLAVIRFFRAPSAWTALAAGVGYAAVMLAYGKSGLMALPVMAFLAAAEYLRQEPARRPSLRLILWAAGAFFLLAVVPNLPVLRESGLMVMFELGPFEGWQQAFSTKSALGWVDRGGMLTQGMDSSYAPTAGGGGTYLGLVVFGIFVAGLLRGTFHETGEGRKARLFFALALFSFWLSFGPRGVLGGHLSFLGLSAGAADYVPALGWFFLAIQVWVIFRLVPPEWPFHAAISSLISAVYLAVPGFRLIEILPIYKNIRAPFDFFHVAGAICVVVSAAMIGRLLLASLRAGAFRSGLLAAVAAVALLDAAPYAKNFFRGAMEREVFEDFLTAQKFLQASPVPGRVYAFSGRYFYLLTPMLSGRPLVAEAFNNYLQQRGAAILQAMAFQSDETLKAFLKISGVSHLLVDKTDPDTPRELQEKLRKQFPVVFDSPHFAILENAPSLGEGFLAEDFVVTQDASSASALGSLGGAHYNMAAIELVGVAPDEPGLKGRVNEGKIEPIDSPTALREGVPFVRVPTAGRGDYQTVFFGTPGSRGWLVMNQAWHPDWTAADDLGHPLPVRKAFLAFNAVKTDGKSGVTFRFQQPWWYNLCGGITIIAWLAALSWLAFRRPPSPKS